MAYELQKQVNQVARKVLEIGELFVDDISDEDQILDAILGSASVVNSVKSVLDGLSQSEKLEFGLSVGTEIQRQLIHRLLDEEDEE